jgi:hypothetical protein
LASAETAFGRPHARGVPCADGAPRAVGWPLIFLSICAVFVAVHDAEMFVTYAAIIDAISYHLRTLFATVSGGRYGRPCACFSFAAIFSDTLLKLMFQGHCEIIHATLKEMYPGTPRQWRLAPAPPAA